MSVRTVLAAALIGTVALTTVAPPADAQSRKGSGLRLIRDAEIEDTIRQYADPIFGAVGMSSSSIKVYLINDRRLNAFVAGGQNMFLNTGLLIEAKHAGQVIGVIAHEAGHIAGGHLVRLRDAIREAQIKQILAVLLGAAVGVAARDSGAGLGTITLGSKIAEGTFLKYTRIHERSADQFAVNALDQAGISSKGLLEFMERIRGQELLITTRQDPYVRSHPLTRDRIAFIRAHIAKSPVSNRPLPRRFVEMHARMRAKLIGFLDPPARVFQIYKPSDNSLASRYARAIARHRQAETKKALALVDGLIKERPRDPYFYDLKGQILFEGGDARGAAQNYATAARYAPNAPLIRTSLGQAQLALNTPKSVASALRNLRVAVRGDDTIPLAWLLLGNAYGKQRNFGMASVAYAEYGLLIGDKKRVKGNIGRAERHLKKGSPAWHRIQDIKREVERQEAG